MKPSHGTWLCTSAFSSKEKSGHFECVSAPSRRFPLSRGVRSEIHSDHWTDSKLAVVAAKVLPEQTKKPTRL